MYQEKHIYRSGKWKYTCSIIGLLTVLCLALVCLYGEPALVHADGVPGGNVSDPRIRAVDIAKPAVVRIITQVNGQVTVVFNKGQSKTFPLTPQQGVNGYPLGLSGTGTFISAHGDILTADHVINPVQDDKQGLDQALDQKAAPDIASYINQNFNQNPPVTADQVAQELVSGQLQSSTKYDQPQSQVLLSTDFTGPLTATSLQNIPPSQVADVDKIKAQSPFAQKDLAIIHVSGKDNKAMVQLGDSSSVQEQDNLTIIGFPGNGDVSNDPSDFLTSSINTVMVSSIKAANTISPLIQVGGNVEHGDSGGPALDSHGNVVGVVSFGVGTDGSTSFLRASNAARQMIQQANIDTTPSDFQKAWSQAFMDYASTTPGHWHKATQEFQDLLNQYPQFKAVNEFLQYATQQSQTETPTASNASTPTASSNPVAALGGNNNTLIIVAAGVILLIILIGGGVAITRRRKPAVVASNGYSSQPPASFPGAPPQSYPGNSLPQAPAQSYPNQGYAANSLPPSSVQNFAGNSLPQAPAQSYPNQQPVPNQGYVGNSLPQSPVPQQVQSYPGRPAIPTSAPNVQSQAPQQAQSYPGRPAIPTSVPNVQSQAPQQSPFSPSASSMGAFGAPMPNTPAPNYSDETTIRAQPAAAGPEWRTWPCGHTNRSDARFCGICGEPAPRPPLVRRVEQ